MRDKVIIPYKPRNWAKPFHASLARWSCLVLHRRAGKTTAILNHHQRSALDDGWEARRLRHLVPELTDRNIRDLLRNRHYGHVMPTYRQAKMVAWGILKEIASGIAGIGKNEVELTITYPNGCTVGLFGADNPDALRGTAFSGLSFDEYSQHPPNIFSEVLSKSLADHLGYGAFVGTIKGKNQLYRTYEAGKGNDEWFTLWQDIEHSLKTEKDAATIMLKRAMLDDQKLIDQGTMTFEEYQQEWFLSTDAAIKGSYYTHQLSKARKDGRIGRVPYDPSLPVDTDWDLGVGDAMAIWFTQSLRTGEIRVIDYYESSGEGLPHYVGVLHDRGYVYGEHWAPHDIKIRELGTGKSRLETAAALGLKFHVTQKIALADGIQATRNFLAKCWFDEEKTDEGREALLNYRKAWNTKLQEFADRPVHDWASHAADAFRGLAVRHKPPNPKRADDYGDGSYATGGRTWMS